MTVLVSYLVFKCKDMKTLSEKIYAAFGSGGCNGCLNEDDPENEKLIDFVDELEVFYKEHGSSFKSRF